MKCQSKWENEIYKKELWTGQGKGEHGSASSGRINTLYNIHNIKIE